MEFTGLTSASHMSLPEAGYGSEEGYVGSEISGAGFHLKLDAWNWVASSYPDNFKSGRYSANMIELFLRRLKLNISRDTH